MSPKLLADLYDLIQARIENLQSGIEYNMVTAEVALGIVARSQGMRDVLSMLVKCHAAQNPPPKEETDGRNERGRRSNRWRSPSPG